MIAIFVSMTLQTVLQQKKKKKHIVDPNLQSAMRPAEHSENLPVPKPPDQEMQIVHKLEPQKMGIWLRRVDKT